MAYRFETSGKLKILSNEELLAADADSAVIVQDDGMMEDGTPYWLYIAIKPSKYKDFMQAASKRESII